MNIWILPGPAGSGRWYFTAGKFLAFGSFLLLLLSLPGCGGGGSGSSTVGSSGAEWYYHWTCNGDTECLRTMSTASGTIDEGPDPLPGRSNCAAAMSTHGTAAGWHIPPAKEWCDFNPTIKPLSAIVISPANPDLNQNYPRQLIATAVYTDGSTSDVTSQVAWSSASAAVVSVAAGGLATGVSVGSTTVLAKLGSVTGSTTLSVSNSSLQSLTITPANAACIPGTTTQLYAVGGFSDGSSYVIPNGVTWSSNSNAVAGIGSGGQVSCFAAGSTTITAADGPATKSSVLQVYSAARFAYSANTRTSNVAQYTLASSGGMTPMSPATISTIAADTIAVDPSGKYLYLGSANGGLAQFTIGSNGALTAMSPAIVATGSVTSIAVDPSGSYLYAANYNTSGNVYQFTIGSNGTLTAMATPSVAAGYQPVSLAVDPADRFVYVLNTGSTGAGSVSEYSIGSSGGLTPIATANVPGGDQPQAIAVDPSGRFVYVVNQGGTNPASITQYYINSDGTLAAMAENTVTPATTCGPKAIAIDSDGNFAYVACNGDNTIAEFGIGADGALTALINATIATTDGPVSIAVDPSGRYVYASYYGSSSTPVSGIDQYSIGTDGTLTQLATPTAATGTDPGPIATTW